MIKSLSREYISALLVSASEQGVALGYCGGKVWIDESSMDANVGKSADFSG